MVERSGDGLVFIAKPHHIHSPLWPAIRSPRFLVADGSESLQFEWSGAFPVREEILIDAADVERELRRIVRSSTRPDPLGAAMRLGRRSATTFYRAARRRVGALRRA
jgi:hypothetical protein